MSQVNLMAATNTDTKTDNSISVLPDAICRAIDLEATKFPVEQKRSVVMAALRMVQKSNGGFLTNPLIDAVADYLEMPRIAVYEVATFYALFDLKPVGRHKIYICTNISCMLMGSDEIVAHFKKRIGIGLGETTADGRITLKEAECLAVCDGAPMCQLNLRFYENLTPDSVDALLASLD